MKNKIIIWIIIGLITLNSVLAIGLSPAKKTITYDQNSKTLEFLLVNNAKKDFDARLLLEGPMARFAKLDIKEIHMNANEDMKKFKVTINMPEKIESNKNYLFISAEEISKEEEGFQALLKVSSKITIEYPNKKTYMIQVKGGVTIVDYKKEFFIDEINEFTIGIMNEYEEDIKNAYTIIKIDNESIKSPLYDLKAEEITLINTYWTPNILGEQEGTIELYYNNKIIKENITIETIEITEEKPVTYYVSEDNPYRIIIIIALLIIITNIVWFIIIKKSK